MFGSMFDFQGRVGIKLDTACPNPPRKIGVSDFTELDDFTSSVCRVSSKGNFELDCQLCLINGLGARFNPSSFHDNQAQYSKFDFWIEHEMDVELDDALPRSVAREQKLIRY